MLLQEACERSEGGDFRHLFDALKVFPENLQKADEFVLDARTRS